MTCSACGYDKVRALGAGDDRTLAQLRESLRCGGCRAWAKNGNVEVLPIRGFETDSICADTRSSAGIIPPGCRRAGQSRSARQKRNARYDHDQLSQHVRVTCTVCETCAILRRRHSWGNTPEEISQRLDCDACGARGANGKIEAELWYGAPLEAGVHGYDNTQPNAFYPWGIVAGLIWIVLCALTAAVLYSMLPVLIDAAVEVAFVSLSVIGAALSVLVIAAIVAACICSLAFLCRDMTDAGAPPALAVVAVVASIAMTGAIFALGGRLLFRAMDYEISDSVRHSPNGGYYADRGRD